MDNPIPSLADYEKEFNARVEAEMVTHKERATNLLERLKAQGIKVTITSAFTRSGVGYSFVGAGEEKHDLVSDPSALNWSGWTVEGIGDAWRSFNTLNDALGFVEARFPESPDYSLFSELWEKRLEKIYAAITEAKDDVSFEYFSSFSGSGSWKLQSKFGDVEGHKWFSKFTDLLQFVEEHYGIK